MSDSLPPYPGPQPPAEQPGAPQWNAPSAGQPVASRRPGGVTAASVITIILSALTVLSGIAFAVASGPLADYVRDNPDVLEGVSEADRQEVLDVMGGALIGLGVFVMIVGAIGILLGILVLKPRPWARILLTIAAALTVVVGLIASFNLVGIPWLGGSIAVIVLLFAGKANDWFAGRPARY